MVSYIASKSSKANPSQSPSGRGSTIITVFFVV